MDIVIIKLFRNEITNSDYHDIMIDDYEEKIKELHKYGEKINKKILFTVTNTMSPISGDFFAEVTTNCALTEQEKNYFVETIKYFCGDAEFNRGRLKYETFPVTVLFNQTHFDDIYET